MNKHFTLAVCPLFNWFETPLFAFYLSDYAEYLTKIKIIFTNKKEDATRSNLSRTLLEEDWKDKWMEENNSLFLSLFLLRNAFFSVRLVSLHTLCRWGLFTNGWSAHWCSAFILRYKILHLIHSLNVFCFCVCSCQLYFPLKQWQVMDWLHDVDCNCETKSETPYSLIWCSS